MIRPSESSPRQLHEDGVGVDRKRGQSTASQKTFRFVHDEIGEVVGDVAWGGNWFYLVKNLDVDFHATTRDELLQMASTIRREINRVGLSRRRSCRAIRTIHLTKSPILATLFCVLASQYDRSPCGTGTSAKLACLAADGSFEPGQTWRQEGILGTVFSRLLPVVR